MIRLRHKLLIHLIQVFDQVLLLAALGAIAHLGPKLSGEGGVQVVRELESGHPLSEILGIILLSAGWVLIFNYLVRYRADRLVTWASQVKDLLKATTLSTFWLVVISVPFSLSSVSTLGVVVFWISTTLFCGLSRVFVRAVLMVARRSGYNFRYLLIVGFNQRAREMAERIDRRPELGYKIVGFISEEPKASRTPEPAEVQLALLGVGDREHESGVALSSVEWEGSVESSVEVEEKPKIQEKWDVIGSIDELEPILEKGTVDEIMICLPFEKEIGTIGKTVWLAHQLGIVARVFPNSDDANLLKNLRVESFEGENVVTLFREQMVFQLLVKRLFDIVFSASLLVLLSVPLMLVALAIRLSSPGPAFFVQERVGMNKRRFKLYKFRSMVMNAEEQKDQVAHMNEMDGPVFKVKKDPRITPLGRFLRKTSIDELPQLVNVLRGEMSFVGPRPPVPSEVDQYELLYRKRLSVKPGITCLWQVRGRNEVGFSEWMDLDSEYIEHWSLWLDFKILLKTIPVVLFCRGAS